MAGDGGLESRFEELYVSAREARRRAHFMVQWAEATLQEARATWQMYQQAEATAERLCELWLSERRESMRYSVYARLQARLATMPVIEQAKGVIMARFGWSEEEAIDALRKASQRSNIRVRDLAAAVVASTVRSAQPPPAVSKVQAIQEVQHGKYAPITVRPQQTSATGR